MLRGHRELGVEVVMGRYCQRPIMVIKISPSYLQYLSASPLALLSYWYGGAGTHKHFRESVGDPFANYGSVGL